MTKRKQKWKISPTVSFFSWKELTSIEIHISGLSFWLYAGQPSRECISLKEKNPFFSSSLTIVLLKEVLQDSFLCLLIVIFSCGSLIRAALALIHVRYLWCKRVSIHGMFRANIAFASKMKLKLFQTKGVLTKRTCREGYTALGFIQSNCRGVAIVGQDTTHCSILIIKDRH